MGIKSTGQLKREMKMTKEANRLKEKNDLSGYSPGGTAQSDMHIPMISMIAKESDPKGTWGPQIHAIKPKALLPGKRSFSS